MISKPSQLRRTSQRNILSNVDPIAGIALSGGGSHGAYAAGIVHTAYSQFFKEGRIPRVKVIAGTSTGSLVAGLLCQFYGRYKSRNDPLKSLRDLERVYTKTTQADIGFRPKGMINLVFNLFWKKGVMDVSPLRSLIGAYFEPHHMADALDEPHPTAYACNFIDMVSGQHRYVYSSASLAHDREESLRMHAAIFASCAQPVVMTPAFVDERWAVDGGVREVIPFREAMRQGCTAVLAVALNEPELDANDGMDSRHAKNPLHMIERGLEVMNDEVARDDERLAFLTAYLNRAKDAVRDHVSADVFAQAFPKVCLPDDVDVLRPGAQDPYENGVYNRSELRDILLFRFEKRDLPKTDEFSEKILGELFEHGVQSAHDHLSEIRDLLFVGGALEDMR